MNKPSIYQQEGVDPMKENVRKIFGRIVRNDFPGAFVNIARDPDRPGVVFTKHPDGDGSKIIQRVLHYLITGDATIFQGAVDDAFSMNTGDIAASGFVLRYVITQIININARNVGKVRVMEQIALRVESLLALYQSRGFSPVFFLGGETADLPHQVQTVVYDADIYAETLEANLVKGNVRPGDSIYGFASDGQAAWETVKNSGLMSNGLTLARLVLMLEEYGNQYPFLIRPGDKYRGKFRVMDKPDILGGMTVSEALLSPTRQWAIFIRILIDKLKQEGIFEMLHGISMNTGGGATKITNVGQGILYAETMPEPPPIFRLVQAESGETWEAMYQDYNCGVGINVVGESDQRFKAALAEVSRTTGIQMFELGVCQYSASGKNDVMLGTPFGNFSNYIK